MQRVRCAADVALALAVALCLSSLPAATEPLGRGITLAATVAWPVSTLVVSEVQTGGASASDEFVEIANQGAGPVDLIGLEVVYATSSGSTVTRKATWSASTIVPPGRRILLANGAGSYVGLGDATYTGGFAATKTAKARRYDAGRFSFNVAKGRCETCEGEGFVSVELLFMPSVFAPCPTCHGARYNAKTLEVEWNGRNIAQVLAMTVDEALAFFADESTLQRPLQLLHAIGLGYLRLGQPATELSGGEAQRIKLATELQRSQRGDTLYILDEPTTGLHPADVERLMVQLHGLVEAGNTVVVVEHEMGVVAEADWVIDMGPGAGEAGGRIVAEGPPEVVARAKHSRTAPYLASRLASAG